MSGHASRPVGLSHDETSEFVPARAMRAGAPTRKSQRAMTTSVRGSEEVARDRLEQSKTAWRRWKKRARWLQPSGPSAARSAGVRLRPQGSILRNCRKHLPLNRAVHEA